VAAGSKDESKPTQNIFQIVDELVRQLNRTKNVPDNDSRNRCYAIIFDFSFDIISHVVYIIDCLIAAMAFANLNIVYNVSA